MDPEPPPRYQPPSPPPIHGHPPPLPPPWPAHAPPAGPRGGHLVQWTFGTLTLLAVAAAALFVFVGHHPTPPASGQRSPHNVRSAPPSATPVPGAIAKAANQYLAAVASINADGDRFHAALAADASLPCSCSPGEFAIRADSLTQIPALNRDIESLQGVLGTIKYEVPGIAADIDTVVRDNQQYMYWLAAAYRASAQSGEAGVGNDISTAVALDTASAADFVRLRSDLGLPPPPSG
jgi:hypothetical protein